MKLYLHYDGVRGPDHTFVWKSGGAPAQQITGRSLAGAMAGFVDSYHGKHGQGAYDGGMDPALLRLVAENASGRRSVTLDTTSDEVIDPDLVGNGFDLKVEQMPEGAHDELNKKKKRAPVVPVSAAVGGSGGVDNGARKKEGGGQDSTEISALVRKLLAGADKLSSQKNLRGARDLLKEAVKLDPKSGKILRRLAGVYFDARLFEEAFAAAKECIGSASDSGPADYLRAARCLMELGRHSEARTALARARTAGPGKVTNDADAALALCSLILGDGPGAADLYMDVLSRTDEKHVEALVGYGRLAVLVKQTDKALPSLLKAVIIDQEHKETRKVLAGALGTPEGMLALRDQMPPVQESASAYSFLGTITKEHGEIDTSVELLKVAAMVDPQNASYALGLVHGHETRGDYGQAVAAAKAFLSGNPSGRVGPKGANNSDVLQVLDGITRSSSSSSSSSPPPTLERLAVHWGTISKTRPGLILGSGSSSGSNSSASTEDITFAWFSPVSEGVTVDHEGGNGNGGGAGGRRVEGVSGVDADIVCGSGNSATVAGTAAAATGEVLYESWVAEGRKIYTPAELDLLALYFTLVKILYLEGEKSRLAHLLRLVEPLRARSFTPLHQTSIRNEQAYYCCIAQLLSCSNNNTCDAPAAPEPCAPISSASSPESKADGDQDAAEKSDREAVYVCGDSHTLTPAWREVTVGGRRRVLKPALVTGLKHWHLRPESNFYPKRNFERVVENIPDGSAVVFLFGEIDCREGILLAVDKMRYENVASGVEHTAGIFVKVAEGLARRRGFRVFVHPVVPVLDETRDMVKTYNRVLRRMVNKSKHLSWLDFFDALLDDAGKNLQPEFRLDGTHLGVTYVRLLEKALGDVWVEEGRGKVAK